MKYAIRELDLFFMSYGEPNAAKHWAHTQDLIPWAQHVKDIKGFDAVHRACGELAQTPYLITIDADTLIHPGFVDIEIEVPFQGASNLCWRSVNAVNGLVYGNGGIKLWEREFIRNMACHEFGNSVDFCWSDNYTAVPKIYSDVVINGSALQAYRAGFREGVKLSTKRGVRLPKEQLATLGPWNVEFLSIWCTVGLDVRFGEYAILGARHGLIENAKSDQAIKQLNDLEHLTERFNAITDVQDALAFSEKELSLYTPFSFPIFSREHSAFFKNLYSTRFANLR